MPTSGLRMFCQPAVTPGQPRGKVKWRWISTSAKATASALGAAHRFVKITEDVS